MAAASRTIRGRLFTLCVRRWARRRQCARATCGYARRGGGWSAHADSWTGGGLGRGGSNTCSSGRLRLGSGQRAGPTWAVAASAAVTLKPVAALELLWRLLTFHAPRVRAAAVDALGAVRARCRHGAACLEVPHAAAHAAAGGRAPLLTATCRHRSTVAYSPAACCAWPPSTLSSRKTHLKRARAWWGWVWWQGSRGGRADRVVLLDCVGGGEPPSEQPQAPSAHAHCSAVRDQPGARGSGRPAGACPIACVCSARCYVTSAAGYARRPSRRTRRS